MASKQVSICDECEKEGKYNHNYSRPNDWISASFACNNRSKGLLDFCSKECLKKYIDSEAIGNDIGHEIKEFAKSELPAVGGKNE